MRTSVAAWEKWYREAWTEQRPEQLEITKEEMFDWLADNATDCKWVHGTDMNPGHWLIACDDLPAAVKGKTLRQAVQIAAAQLEKIT